ncbi:Radical SAM domain protein [Desulfofarcimen acetoxidans DSM 771]|jgi:aminodeoxyfutalosine synthase|uniref:Aminodeoxyfutalosine synthase n=1 Tax=Desulfofarcimen acetoxidans (strain ATCC 49208 / DSM 771 / KCTC 5769 / VKM B-1644 / 5575) TaxID=485916 RepID=C8VWE8_DESAS|nr:aminofutalosine synthase MqnE [Desulfofarcimen acetoxidans]ACV62500.1 Radical SAM domain protein [Desulfofarcimen acetoxidans DSM 771]
MEGLFLKSGLEDIAERVLTGKRLSFNDGVRLLKSPDILTIGYLASHICRQKNGDRVHFIVNRHINHTNICANRCKFCAFGRDAGDKGAYVLSLDEIEAKALASRNENISEIHIVGGLNPDLKLDYYVEALKRVKRVLPGVIIQSFTAVEVAYLAEQHNMSLQEVLITLKEAGLDSLPGGGAEVFAPRVRDLVCEKKISGEHWLAVHEAAHGIGMRTNATMLYGHVETIEERVDHLIKLRDLQDSTGGFLTFIPLAFHPKNTPMEAMGLARSTGYDDLKVLAVSRLLLDNFDHIKAYWLMIGPKLAQVSLAFGVDDLDGTVVEEQIAHDAGADTEQYMSKKNLINMIKAAGRIPVERDTLYNTIREGF